LLRMAVPRYTCGGYVGMTEKTPENPKKPRKTRKNPRKTRKKSYLPTPSRYLHSQHARFSQHILSRFSAKTTDHTYSAENKKTARGVFLFRCFHPSRTPSHAPFRESGERKDPGCDRGLLRRASALRLRSGPALPLAPPPLVLGELRPGRAEMRETGLQHDGPFPRPR